jgi:hypothetical protein
MISARPTVDALITEARKEFHSELVNELLVLDNGTASNADTKSKASIRIANAISRRLNAKPGTRLPGQTSGSKFEETIQRYLESTFLCLQHLRPGRWEIYNKQDKERRKEVGFYSQYSHLVDLRLACNELPTLAAALGNDYLISPDIVVVRQLESDHSINGQSQIVDCSTALNSDLREGKGKLPLLHASISAKWTLRSDRAQNARSEGLNLIRNRKGRQPHIVVVTGEPMPSRISSLALGTGDIDCVYHIALYEYVEALLEVEGDASQELLNIMIEGKRLKDISDLPLDLAC